MVVHISPGRRGVIVLNIPRDTQVPYYACPAGRGAGQVWPGQEAVPGALERINAVLAAGGPSCLWTTIEQQTGIRISHFIGIGLSGFVNVVDDLGGVNVCVPFTVDDPASGLQLAAGEHHIGGVQALAFWRTREGIGTGSDLQRIQRDQYLLAQVLRGTLSAGLLSSPPRLLTVIRDAARAMTTDTGLTPARLLQIAASLRQVPSRDVQFVTAPSMFYPPDPAEVEFEQPEAAALFSAIARDSRLPRPASTSGAARVAEARPSQVRVRVLNGSGAPGIAGQAAAALASRGFDVTGTGNAASFAHASSEIEYPSAAVLPAVRALENQLPAATIRRVRGLAAGTVSLIVGSSFTTLAARPSPASAAGGAKAAGQLAEADGGITGSASCTSDAGAFAGPLSPGG
jgi:LCP family protein required for cell wall assembly